MTEQDAFALEGLLARLYADDAALQRFVAAPRAEAERAGLGPVAVQAALQLDLDDLRAAAASFAHKRRANARHAARARAAGSRLAALGRAVLAGVRRVLPR